MSQIAFIWGVLNSPLNRCEYPGPLEAMELLQFGGEIFAFGVDAADGQRHRPNLNAS